MKAIKYGASWCHQCKGAETLLKNASIPFTSIDVDENEAIAEEKNIRSIPYIEFFNDDEDTPFYTHAGGLSSDIINKVKEQAK